MKRYIMPTLKVLIALVIAVSLVKVAFFSNAKTLSGPTGSYTVATQTTTATVGDISNTVNVEGQIVADAPVEVPATLEGKVDSFAVDSGAKVSKGDQLLYLKGSEQVPVTTYYDDGTQETQTQEKTVWATVYAPADGVVTFKVIKDQDASVGTVVATISPGTYSATGSITASERLQLTNNPTSAQLTLQGGPAPFTCTDLSIGTKATTSTTTDPSGQTTTTTADGTVVEVRCPVSTDQNVFAGLPVTIGIDAGSASGVVLAPITAVEGTTNTGNVWVVTDPKNPDAAEKREVSLGINDGTNIQITDGLQEGEEILLFVPNKNVARTGTPNTCDDFACYDEKGQEYM